jgi:hypothetical protein
MIRTKLVNGNNAIKFKITALVTLDTFSLALGEESYNGEKGELIDFKKLKKKDAMEILKTRLQRHGRMGEYQGLDDIGDNQEILNTEVEKARAWVAKKYPYLINADIL